MDSIVCDITNAPISPSVGDTVELFGDQIAIEDCAASCRTNGYEMLTSLGGRVERRYLWNEKPAADELLRQNEVV